MSDPDNIVPFRSEAPKKGFSQLPMKSELVDKASETIPDPHLLINVVSRRVDQLNNGSAPRVQTLPSMGAADVALLEVIEGKLTFTLDAKEGEY